MKRFAPLLILIAGTAHAAPPDWLRPPTLEPQWLGAARPKSTPKRIVTVAPSATELIFALGAGDRLVGVSRYDDYPREVTKLPKVGGFLDPSAEAVLALAPDLLVAAPNASNRPILERLAQLGVPVFVVPGNSFSDLFHSTEAIAKAIGKTKEGAQLIEQMRRDVDRIRSNTARGSKPRVAFVYDRNPLVLGGPGSFAATLLDLVGAENVVKVDREYPTYAREQLLLDAPEVVIDASLTHWASTSTDSDEVLRSLKLEERDALGAFWAKQSTLPAVKKQRVYGVVGTALLRPAPRLIAAMGRLAEVLHHKGARSISK